MDKRYQVFVSSTFADLQEERQEVMQALLELDCMPAGMELFPAANDDQWTLIKKVIDDSDYYIVIVAGRYGSLGPDGKSYTEMEYRYALSKGKPVIGFLYKEPGKIASDRSEQTEAGKSALAEFRKLVEQKPCRFWDSPADLGSQVSRSLVKLIKSHPAIGWVRADLVPDLAAAEEILSLKRKIEDLEGKLSESTTRAPAGSEELAQGSDRLSFDVTFSVWTGADWTRRPFRTSAAWDEIFAQLAPLMIHEASETQLKAQLETFAASRAREENKNLAIVKNADGNFAAREVHFHTVIIQLRALGLITKSSKPRSVKDTATYWTLTPYGDSAMTRLRAIRRTAAAAHEDVLS
jgi:hypothetical protein